MFSTRSSMRSSAASFWASARLSPSDSFSGRARPSTRLGPTACTASAAHTELSMPPLIATTNPERRSTVPTCWRRASTIAWVARAGSSRSCSGIATVTPLSSLGLCSARARFEPQRECGAGATTGRWYARCCVVIGMNTGGDVVDMNCNAALLLWRTANRGGGRPGIVERDVVVDCAALARRAAAVASALTAAGAGRDSPVAIFLERGCEAAAAFFGTLAAGGIAVFVNEGLRPRQIDHILAHSGARHLITTAELLARQPRALQGAAHVVDVGMLPVTAEGALVPVTRLGNDVAQIIYTSGSTGQPKGVTVSHANIEAAAHTVVSYLEISDADRIASLLPFSFVYGLSQLLCAVTAGGALGVGRSPLPPQAVAALCDHQVTILAAAPALWMRLLSAGGFRDTPLP